MSDFRKGGVTFYTRVCCEECYTCVVYAHILYVHLYMNPAHTSSPSLLVIFGVTGDLAAKKIIPALWYLFQHERLPSDFSVIGYARRDLSEEAFFALIRESLEKYSGGVPESDAFAQFCTFFSYHRGTFENADAFRTLAQRIQEKEDAWKAPAHTLFYFAAPPTTYESIFKNLAGVDLNRGPEEGVGWSRVLIEKPFGEDAKTAEDLQTLLSAYFTEEQIYRIDHYLFKEIVQGIENFRFSNNLFEHSWDSRTIERIDIRLHESIGAEGRGSFYDSVGALRDVGQNHLLMMLAAITMEYPANASADTVQKNRTTMLQTLVPWTDELVKQNTFRAQYRGYHSIEGVAPDSQVETYFALKTELDHPKWKGVPVFLEAGKKLKEARKEIVLTLKHPPVCLLCEVTQHEPNHITFRLEPNNEIIISFWAKKPGFEKTLEKRSFSFFLYEREVKSQYVEEYAKVIHTALEGDRSLFTAREEVEALWKFIDPVVAGWGRNLTPLAAYEPGTTPSPDVLTSPDTEHIHHKKQTLHLGYIGLGKMGMNMVERLLERGYEITAFDKNKSAVDAVVEKGAYAAMSLQKMVKNLKAPRTLWVMVPHMVVDTVLSELVPLLEKGDVIIDGGNSPYKESLRRAQELARKGIHFLDVGVSGGPGGARNGASIMVGGERELYERYSGLFADLAVERGYGYMGASGAGHFVKMVHNGIEYGMMQALGEGFEVMKESPFALDMHTITEVYNHGSVVTSRLVGWLADAYEKFGPDLDTKECCSGSVAATGEGQWTVDAAKELGIPVAVIEEALRFRARSQEHPSYTGRVLSALRHEFGGHDAQSTEKNP